MSADLLTGRTVLLATTVDHRTNPLHARWIADWCRAFQALGAEVTFIARHVDWDGLTDDLHIVGVRVAHPVRADLRAVDGAVPLEAFAGFVLEQSALLGRQDILLAQGRDLSLLLADSGEVAHCLHAMPLDDPLARLRLDAALAEEAQRLAAGSNRVVVTDVTAAGWLEGGCDSLASRVLCWPAWAHLDDQRVPDAGASVALIHPGFARPSHARLIGAWAEELKRNPAPVGVVGDAAAVAAFRAGPGRELGWSLPSLVPAPPTGEGKAPCHGLALGSLAEQDDDTSLEAARWFEAHGVAPLVSRGSLADREGPARWARLDRAVTVPTPETLAQEPRLREADDLVADLARLLRRPEPPAPGTPVTRVLLAGRNFKFAGDLIAYLDARADVELRLHHPDQISPEDRARLNEWADVVICEFAEGQALWHSQHAREGQRVIVRLHGYELYSAWIDQLDVAGCSAVVFVSEHHRATAHRLKGWPEDKLKVIPNSVDLVDLDRTKFDDARFHLGLVGIVPVLKRAERAVDLLELLRREDPRFRLFVRGHHPWTYTWEWKKPLHREAYLAMYERIRSTPGLAEAVSFEGFGPAIGDWFRKIGWMLSPSQRESFHLAPVEGMVGGAVPVVWERAGAIDIFSERWTHADTREAADFIAARALDPQVYLDETMLARQFVGRYGATRCNDLWADLIATVAPGSSGSREGVTVATPPVVQLQNIGLLVRGLWDSGAHAEARSVLEAHPDKVAAAQASPQLASSDLLLRARALVLGWTAIHPKLSRLLGAPRSPRPATDDVLLVSGPVTDAARRWGASVGRLHTVTLAEPYALGGGPSGDVTDPGLDLDAYLELAADRIAARALTEGAGLIVAAGPDWLACASALAAARLGVDLWWDLRGDAATLERVVTGTPYLTPQPSPLLESTHRVARFADAVITDAPGDLSDVERHLQPRLVRDTDGDGVRAALARRSSGSRLTPVDRPDGPWHALASLPGPARLTVVGARAAEVAGLPDAAGLTELDPELVDALLVDASTPQAWTETLPTVYLARRYAIPVLTWGTPATGRALVDAIIHLGPPSDDLYAQPRPALSVLVPPVEGAAALDYALRAVGFDAPVAQLGTPDRAPVALPDRFVTRPPALCVVVHEATDPQAVSETLESLAGQSLHPDLYTVRVVDGPAATPSGGEHPDTTVVLRAGDRLDRDGLLALWQAAAGGAGAYLPTRAPAEPLADGSLLKHPEALARRSGLLLPVAWPRGGYEAWAAAALTGSGLVVREAEWASTPGVHPAPLDGVAGVRTVLDRLDRWAELLVGLPPEARAAAETAIDVEVSRLRYLLASRRELAVVLLADADKRPSRRLPAVSALLG